MPENLNHPRRRFHKSTYLIKGPQPDQRYLKTGGLLGLRGISQQPPAYLLFEQEIAVKVVFRDAKSPLQI